MTEVVEGTAAVRAFWLDEVGPERWWVRSAETDSRVAGRFRGLWEEWRGRPAADFLGSAEEALGAVLLFDQFPRNMFRGQAQAFASDPLALAIAEGAVARGHNGAIAPAPRAFLYMPFMHAEQLSAQERSVALFEALGIETNLAYARTHRDMIARYGRFPARNRALGRADRPGEEEGIAASRDW